VLRILFCYSYSSPLGLGGAAHPILLFIFKPFRLGGCGASYFVIHIQAL